MPVKDKEKKEFVEALNYPAKNLRPLAKWPISVPADPLLNDYTRFKSPKITLKNYFFSLFFTAFDVRDYADSILKLMKVFEPLSIKKVYLETYRDGYTADPETVKECVKKLRAAGIEVSGAVTTTHFSEKTEFNEGMSAAGCYTDKPAMKKMKHVFEMTAAIFDEIIIDDWFFTTCTCPDCRKAKAKKHWDEFRCRLMWDVSKKYVIAPAKKVNPKVKLILKLPQWFEGFHRNGYDLERLLPIYDEIAVGTETRDPLQTPFMPVHGAMLYKYIKGLAPDKVNKAWFDIYLCDEKIYAEQAYQSVIAGAKELILFCAGILPQPKMRPLVENLLLAAEKIDRMSGFNSIFSIPVIRKANTEGDTGLVQYFMMAGIPCYMTASEKPKEKLVMLTAQSASKGGHLKLFTGLLAAKKDMVITAPFAGHLRKYFDVRAIDPPKEIDSISSGGRQENLKHRLHLSTEIMNGKHTSLFNRAYPFVSFFKIKDSRIWVLNLPTSDSMLTDHTGGEFGPGYRYLIHIEEKTRILRHIFEGFANLNLYDKVKTLYKYHI